MSEVEVIESCRLCLLDRSVVTPVTVEEEDDVGRGDVAHRCKTDKLTYLTLGVGKQQI